MPDELKSAIEISREVGLSLTAVRHRLIQLDIKPVYASKRVLLYHASAVEQVRAFVPNWGGSRKVAD